MSDPSANKDWEAADAVPEQPDHQPQSQVQRRSFADRWAASRKRIPLAAAAVALLGLGGLGGYAVGHSGNDARDMGFHRHGGLPGGPPMGFPGHGPGNGRGDGPGHEPGERHHR